MYYAGLPLVPWVLVCWCVCLAYDDFVCRFVFFTFAPTEEEGVAGGGAVPPAQRQHGVRQGPGALPNAQLQGGSAVPLREG